MRASMVFSGRALLLATLMTSGAVSISGCAQLQSFGQKLKDAQTSSATATHSEASAVNARDERKELAGKRAPLLSLKQIMHLIENGEHDQARAALETFLEKDSDNQAAKNLQKQLTIDPAKVLGPAVSTYTVQSGDTLGGLASRFLGNPMNFVILGRYNDIKRGRDLRVGQTIKIPSLKKLKALPDESPTRPVRQPTSETPAEKSTAPKEVESSASLEKQAVPAVESPTMKPEIVEPNAIVKPKSPVDAAGAADALAAQQAGLAAMQKNQLEQAEAEFSKALAINPNLEPAKTQAGQVRKKLVQQYHEAALVAYRKQHLDEAIALWDKALALDPNYEPALGYRARAQELKRRLGQLNAH